MSKIENKFASIIAFFLSKFNEQALNHLNYATFKAAFNELAKIINAKPDYIRLRRDEFDAFFPNGPRQGFNKREPAPCVIELFKELNIYSFEELGLKVKQLLEINCNNEVILNIQSEISKYSEEEIESIINFEDDNSAIRSVNKIAKQRILNYSIIPRLKELYNYQCQICGKNYNYIYGVNIVEGHHMEFFVDSINNNASNIIILCPDHHRLMHKAKPRFDKEQKAFIYPNGYIEKISLNYHL